MDVNLFVNKLELKPVIESIKKVILCFNYYFNLHYLAYQA